MSKEYSLKTGRSVTVISGGKKNPKDKDIYENFYYEEIYERPKFFKKIKNKILIFLAVVSISTATYVAMTKKEKGE